MAAETLTSEQAASTYPGPAAPTGAGILCVSRGTYAVAANVEDGDIFEMSRVPKCLVIGGFIYAEDMDTNATETLDMDIGIAANGVESADPDALGNLGVWEGNAVSDISPETGNFFAYGGVLFEGSLSLSATTKIQIEANAAAATFAAGQMTSLTHYTV